MELPTELSLSAVSDVDMERKSWSFKSDVASSKEVQSAFKKSFTVQFFQPHRFSDELHCINAGFENIFDLLLGHLLTFHQQIHKDYHLTMMMSMFLYDRSDFFYMNFLDIEIFAILQYFC